jgi:hypothetical protein
LTYQGQNKDGEKSQKITNLSHIGSAYHHGLRLQHKTNPKRSNNNKKARTEKKQEQLIEGTGAKKNAGQYHVICGDERVVDT